MILLVTGSRTWADAAYIEKVLDDVYDNAGEPVVLHHGAAFRGADAIANRWALRRQQLGANILIIRHPAQWRVADSGETDRRAGFRRNAEMVKAVATSGGKVITHAFIRDNSSGATHCANEAVKAGLQVVRHRWEAR